MLYSYVTSLAIPEQADIRPYRTFQSRRLNGYLTATKTGILRRPLGFARTTNYYLYKSSIERIVIVT